MTREELKAHCERQIEECEMWAKYKGIEPSGKIYEEHKLILELLEQEPKTEYSQKSCDTCEHSDEIDGSNCYECVKGMGDRYSPQPKIGRWIRFKEFENGYYHIKCSECNQYWSIDGHAKTFRYCFNCGTKMEREEY